MKSFKQYYVYLLFITCLMKMTYPTISLYPQKSPFEHADTQWAIIGAGPAGIITVSLLLWLGVPGKDIVWVDPEFSCGRLLLYANVPGNLNTKTFMEFINACPIFKEFPSEAIQALAQYDPEKFYELKYFIAPLIDITKHLRTRVFSIQTKLTSLDFDNDVWRIGIENGAFTAAHVVLAVGSHPRSLDYDPNKPEIPLDIALDRASLAEQVAPEDSIAVVGSAHSAILLLKFLSELPVARIVNFYKKPLLYVIQQEGWNMNQEEGLKGTAAEWAQNVLEKNPPANLIRIFNKPEALKAWLPICNKIIYAIGYERNPLPPINGTLNNITYDDRTGVIAPRLFGIGIAFPEKYTDPSGHTYHRVGLPFFMEYALRVIPQWINAKDAARKELFSRMASFQDLFTIDIL